MRRVGETTFAGTLENAELLNCDLPSSQFLLADAGAFYRSPLKPRIILDEVPQLPDPSRLLKIGANALPKLKILATGSATLAAKHPFRDSLAGRKRNLHLLPLRRDKRPAYGIRDLRHQLLRGGLPPALRAADYAPGFYSE